MFRSLRFIRPFSLLYNLTFINSLLLKQNIVHEFTVSIVYTHWILSFSLQVKLELPNKMLRFYQNQN